MKSILSLLLLPSLYVAGQGKAFIVKGEVTDWKGRDSVLLMYYNEKDQLKSDTIIAVDGHFEFKGTVSQPVSAYIRLQKPIKRTEIMDNTQLYLEQGTILLNAKDSLRHSTISGNSVNKDFKDLKQLTDPYFKRLVALRMQAMSTTKEQQKTPEFKMLNDEYRALQDSLEQNRIRFVKTNRHSFLSLETIQQIGGPTMQYNKTAPLFEALDPALKQTPLGKKLFASLELAKKSRIGAVMPAFTSLDTARKELHLNDVVSKGKVTLVDFWASWCGPCRAENPNVVKAFNTFHDKGFEIISVSLDDDATRWKDAIIKDGMPWHHVSGLKKWEEPVAVYFGIHGIPDNFLLDAQGKVVGRGLRGEALFKKVQEMTK